MSKAVELQQTLYDASEILERAIMLCAGAPFWTYVGEVEFARVVIDGDEATLYWPEVQSGYYDSTSIESQSKSFPSELLLMSVDETEVWKVQERKKYDAEEKVKAKLEAEARQRQQEANEKAAYEMLKAKYDT